MDVVVAQSVPNDVKSYQVSEKTSEWTDVLCSRTTL